MSINIIPQPQSVMPATGAFEVRSSTRILVTPDAESVGDYLASLLQSATGYALPVEAITEEASVADAILLTTTGAPTTLGKEGYALSVTPSAVVLRAMTPQGLFYGVQTVRQLLPAAIESAEEVSGVVWTIPAVTISDWPRFTWRGMHLDVGRHFFTVDAIKKYIDLMVLHKQNVFHWHLTEDQGWRIEIKGYPKLTEIGSQRTATPFPANRSQLDGKPYGGYYTQEEIKEVVAYAAARFITVVPEIEMPGHAIAALTSYPHLGCVGEDYNVWTYWGIAEDVFCAGNEEVYTFLEDVLSEVLALFPSPFIHIGGDECPKDRWQSCPKCQKMIQEQALQDEHELQSYLVKRIERYLNAQGRRLIGWDEILEGGLAPNATVMSWRGMTGGIAAAAAGHDVVMTPTSHCYFDYYQSENQEDEPPAIGGFIPLETVYAFEPVPADLPADKEHHILGTQANLWSEYIPTEEQLQYMAYPRATALAEVAWSSPAERDYEEFHPRLQRHLKRLDEIGVHYRQLD